MDSHFYFTFFKMESVARDLNDRPDIPFIDSEDTETRLGKLYIF